MGDSPPPKTQDPNVTAATQAQYNKTAATDQQTMNQTNQSGPYGDFKYSQSGTSPDGTPIYTLTSSLSAPNQNLLDLLYKSKTTAGTQAGDLISRANYGAASPTDVIGDATKGLTKQALDQQVSYLKPYQDYERAALDTRLRNQGFNPGEPAYEQQMKSLQNNQDSSVTDYLSKIQPAMMQQATQQYLLPLTMGQQLQQWGTPIDPKMQQTPTVNLQPTNYIGAVANAQDAQLKEWQAQQQQKSAMMSGLFGVGTGVLGAMATGGTSLIPSLLGASSLMAGSGSAPQIMSNAGNGAGGTPYIMY